jgi:hypothetical protein
MTWSWTIQRHELPSSGSRQTVCVKSCPYVSHDYFFAVWTPSDGAARTAAQPSDRGCAAAPKVAMGWIRVVRQRLKSPSDR